MPEKYVRRDGIPILLRHTGRTTLPQNPPALGTEGSIVCLHDAGLQSSVFIDLLAAAAPEGGGLAFDLPGHGRSGGLDSLPSIEGMTEMAKWVADWCHASRPVLVGHGMGALIALEWARSHSESVSGLVLCGLGLALGTQGDAIETMRKVTRGKAPRPFDATRICKQGGQEMMRRAYMEGIQTDPRATLVDLEASRDWAASFDGGAGISCPVALVTGASEDSVCRDRALRFADSLTSVSVCEIDGAAHFLPLEQPVALAHEIRRIAEAC